VRRPVLLLAVCACGHRGFDATAVDAPAADASAADAAPVSPALVAVDTIYATTSSIAVPATIAAGHLVVVVVDLFDSGFSVASVGDGVAGDVYVSANARAIFSAGAMGTSATEIWYTTTTQPSAGSVNVTLTGAVQSFVWVAEFEGIVPTSPLDTVAHTDSGNASTAVAGASVTTASADELVVSIVSLDDSVTGIESGNPFIALPPQGGDDAAYVVAAQPGSYAPVWVLANAAIYCSSTVAFRAAP